MKDWRKEEHPKTEALQKLLTEKKSRLNKDKQFVRETQALLDQLELAHTKRPKAVRLFFRDFPEPKPSQFTVLLDFLDAYYDDQLRDLFRRYVQYVFRFGTIFRFKDKSTSHFTLELLVPHGKKFHVRLAGHHFRPAGRYPGIDEPFDYFFESETLHLPPAIEKQIEDGSAKFVQVEDGSCTSTLSKLETFAYHPDGITLVLHNAEKPYLLCLVGEKVSDAVWRRAYKGISAILRKHYGRGKAGRPPNLRKEKKGAILRRKPGPLKEKAFSLIEGNEKLAGQQCYLSRLKNRMK